MSLDYSKWDNLELSDDSDVEVHPNIERNTFIRLRQRKIHEERENRRLRRERVEALIPMNKDLIQRIEALRSQLANADSQAIDKIVQEWKADVEAARKDKERRDAATKGGRLPDQPTKEEMMAALKARISDDLLKSAANAASDEDRRDELVKQLDLHVSRLRDSLKQGESELEDVLREEAKHVSVDSITKEGFDRSFVSKPSQPPSQKSKPATRTEKRTETHDEVLNPGSVGNFGKAPSAADPDNDVDEDGNLRLDGDSKEFASLKTMTDSYEYIKSHITIVNETKSDQILGHAFALELDGKHALSKQYVRQSLILTYILTMGSSGVRMFFDRIGVEGRAQDMFLADVESRYKHIAERCKVIRSERADDGPEVESIQLQCDDPDAPIRISVPDEDSPDEDPGRLELFRGLPADFQAALRKGTLEAVNEVLAGTPGREAERLLEVCGRGGFLVIDGEVIVDPNEDGK